MRLSYRLQTCGQHPIDTGQCQVCCKMSLVSCSFSNLTNLQVKVFDHILYSFVVAVAVQLLDISSTDFVMLA